MATNLWLIRHGETAWSLTGQHTGRNDIDLTEQGRTTAEALRPALSRHPFAAVFCSPLKRARETCRIVGFAEVAQIDPDMQEWNYGQYEGRTSEEIRRERAGWDIWKDGVPGGEKVQEVGERAQRVLDRAAAVKGDVALFAHGHFLRILTATWLGLPADAGRLFALSTASYCILGHERDHQVISRWNVS